MNYYAKRPEFGCHNDSLTPLGTQASSVPVPSPSACDFPPCGDKGTASCLALHKLDLPEKNTFLCVKLGVGSGSGRDQDKPILPLKAHCGVFISDI